VRIERFDSARHSSGRSAFDCGKPEFNAFLQTLATQQLHKNMLTLWVAFDEANGLIAGYYTLSAASITYTPEANPQLAKGFRAYGTLPAFLIGRLAVDKNYRGQKLGTELVRDALLRCLQTAKEAVAAHAILVDPYEEWLVRKLYKPLGFEPLVESEPFGRQVLLLASVAKGFGKK